MHQHVSCRFHARFHAAVVVAAIVLLLVGGNSVLPTPALLPLVAILLLLPQSHLLCPLNPCKCPLDTPYTFLSHQYPCSSNRAAATLATH